MDYFQNNSYATVFMVLLATIVGVVTSYASMGFLWAIDHLHLFFLGEKGNELYQQLEETSALHIIVLTTVGAVVVRFLIQYGMPEQRNQGPADVIASVRLGQGGIDVKAGIVSALASVVSIGSGASVGRYGPAVHLGASLGSGFAQWLRLTPEHKKTLLSCGVAGAISASFSAPLAGVVFAHEVVLGRFGSRSVIPIVISSVVAVAVVKMHAHDHMIFMLPDLPVVTNWEYFLFALVGVCGGGLAIIFMSMMNQLIQWSQRFSINALMRAALGGVLLGGIVVAFPQVFGLGEQVIRDALQAELTWGVLAMLVLAKLLATSISFAAGFSGGVFGPALFLGTMMGMLFGIAVQELTDSASSVAVYGVVGMGAVISRVIGAPITTILIVFELTGSYSLMTAVMVSVVVGGTVTREFFNGSYFFHQLRVRGIEPETTRTEQALRELSLDSLLSKPSVVISEEMTVTTARNKLEQMDDDIAYVVDHQGKLLGQVNSVILYEACEEKLQAQRIGCCLVEPALVFTKEMSLCAAYSKLTGFKGAVVPVVKDNVTCQLIGVVYVSELAGICLQVFERIRNEAQ